SSVWICSGAFVGPGTTVGANSVVGARACVFKDVPRDVIVGGNPAVVIKSRPRTTDQSDMESKESI
ncbi:hypothetical protein N8550_03800, partial [Pirellulaceae bacterium]|nr:hypothetical protein [Pirellulaceae bacterium]